MFNVERIFSYICVCPSFKLDILTSVLKSFPETHEIKSSQMPMLAQNLSDRGYIKYDSKFFHYNVIK